MYVQEIWDIPYTVRVVFIFFKKCTVVWEAELCVVGVWVQSPVTTYRKTAFWEWAGETGNTAEEAFYLKVNQQNTG